MRQSLSIRYLSDLRPLILVQLLLVAALATAACTSTPASKALPPLVEAKLVSGNWQAGTAAGPLFAPPTLSMGGYGMRPGPTGGLQGRLGGSRGSYGSLMVKAVALENGHAAVIFTKVPIVLPTDLLRRRTLAWLARRSGLDFSDALIITATHTHSGPARYWALPPGFVGYLGLDDFDPQVLDAMAESIASVVLRAWENRQPARIGVTEITRYDPDDRINSDRRSENDNLYTDLNDPNVYLRDGVYKSKDQHMWLLRIDDLDGNPRGGIIRMGVHGTILAHEMHAEDVPGAIETAAEATLHLPFVMYLQGTAGDVTPRGDEFGRSDLTAIEAVGWRAAKVAALPFAAIKTRPEGILAVAHRWLRIDRKVLGYSDREFGQAGTAGAFYPFRFGAILCGDYGADPEPDGGTPETVLRDGYLGCLPIDAISGVAVEQGHVELPIEELSRAVLSAVRIDDWRLVTFPGEPVSQLGTLMTRMAAEKGFEKVSVVGYSQTHLFYLTSKLDWFQGGYEAGMNIWGWQLGEYLARQNLDLLEHLDRYGREPAWDGDPMEPLPREFESHSTVPVRLPPPAWLGLAGQDFAIGDTLTASWQGGDLWIDRPFLVLRTATGGATADSGGFGWRIMGKNDHPEVHELSYEIGADIPPGRYRIEVSGRARRSATDMFAYRLTSAEFIIRPGTLIEVTTATRSSEILFYPQRVSHPESFVWLFGKDLPRYQVGGMRLHSDVTGPTYAAPLETDSVQIKATEWLADGSQRAREETIAYKADCNCFAWNGFTAPVTAVTITAGSFGTDGLVNRMPMVIPR